MICCFPGCDEQVSGRGQFCDMHYKRAERGQEMSAPRRERLTPWSRVVVAAIDLADADSENDIDFSRREARLRYAARRWVGVRPRHSNRG